MSTTTKSSEPSPAPPRRSCGKRYLRAALCFIVVALFLGGLSYLVPGPRLAEVLGRLSVICTFISITCTLAAWQPDADKPPPDRSGS
jgi:hypothetical protein